MALDKNMFQTQIQLSTDTVKLSKLRPQDACCEVYCKLLVRCYAGMLMDAVVAAGLGVGLILVLLILRWKVRGSLSKTPQTRSESQSKADSQVLLCNNGQLVHRLCRHNNVVQSFEIEQKDSLDEHLDILARKLAEKESRLRLSKCKIRETQNEIQNLHAIDHSVRLRYREIMDALRSDLLGNEKECRKLQEQIEWVSRRRAELKEEASALAGLEFVGRGFGNQVCRSPCVVDSTAEMRTELVPSALNDILARRGHKLFGEAATELANNLSELQKGRTERITDKTYIQPSFSPRFRKEPHLPSAPVASLIVKNSPNKLLTEQKTSEMGYYTPM